jgi:RNA polymerase sigma-70 factor (ECF subfamily)
LSCVRNPEERALVDALRRGDVGAFDAVYTRHRARIFGFLLRMSRRRHVAEELSQEVWMKLARNARRLDEDTDLLAWLFTVARNAWVSHRRWSVLDVSRFLVSDELPDAAAAEPAPDAHADARRTLASVERALGRVPASAREVLVLVAVEGLDHAQAASVLGVREEAVRQRLSRARTRLTEELAKGDARGQSGGADV